MTPEEKAVLKFGLALALRVAYAIRADKLDFAEKEACDEAEDMIMEMEKRSFLPNKWPE